MNLPGLGGPHPGGLLLPGAVGQAPWLYPPVPLPAAAPPPQQQVQQHAQQPQHKPANEMSERDVRLLKRKQANRDSARRSKLKKKQETEELVVKRTQLSELHNNLIKRVREAQARVRQLQDTNSGLKQQYTTLLCATEGCAG